MTLVASSPRRQSWPLALLVALACASLPAPSSARDFEDWHARRAERRMAQLHDGRRMDQQRARDAGRGQPMRDRMRDMPRDQSREVPNTPPMAAPPVDRPPVLPDPGGRPGRLTPDERRALRQQINDAGRDVYRPQRP